MSIRKLWILLLLLAVLGTVTVFGVNILKDNKGPEIVVPAGMTYSTDMSDEDLLKEVKAIDDKDGDVSSSLMVENVLVLSSESYAKVIYVAQDSNNNVTEKSVIMVYKKGDNDTPNNEDETPSENETSAEDETTVADETTADNGTPAEEETPEDVQEPTTPVETVSEEAPVLYLTDTEISVKVGSEVKWTSYVSDITDDKDSRSELFKYIMIDDYADLNTVGDYVMSYSCKDTDGNTSPRIKLTVHVTE